MFAIMIKNKPKHVNLNDTTTLLLQNKGARIEEQCTSSSWHSTCLLFTSVGCTGFAFTQCLQSSKADPSTQHRWKLKVFNFTQKISTMHCCSFDPFIYLLQSLLKGIEIAALEQLFIDNHEIQKLSQGCSSLEELQRNSGTPVFLSTMRFGTTGELTFHSKINRKGVIYKVGPGVLPRYNSRDKKLQT